MDEKLVDEFHKAICEHHQFHAQVAINRITDTIPMRFSVDMTVTCIDCGLPFEFVGLPCGYSPSYPTVNPTSQELRCPIRPKSKYVMPGILGDSVVVN